MDQPEDRILDVVETTKPPGRKLLLPWWIKFFCWIFMAMAIFVPLGLIGGVLGMSFEISLYGLATNTPISAIGVLLSSVIIIKGIAAFGLIIERDWAVDFAIADAVVGISICGFMMLIYPLLSSEGGFHVNIRLELLLLVPYLLKMMNIRKSWKARSEVS